MTGATNWQDLPAKDLKPVTKGLYSKVAGDLPLSDIPLLTDNKGQKFSLVQFEINILQEGVLGLKLDGPDQTKVWVGTKEMDLNNGTGELKVSTGKLWINIAFSRNIPGNDSLKVLVMDDVANSAKSQLIVGF
jgi:hypothetical protein